jgi:hypothetical protein
MSFVSVKDRIIEKLSAMQTLKAVYGYPAANDTGDYPYATVTLKGSDAVFRSTATNLRSFSFFIRIYQETTKVGQGPQQAETIVTEITDEFLEAFDKDTTLSGAVHYCKPVSLDASYRNRDHDARILEVQLDAMEVVSTTNY